MNRFKETVERLVAEGLIPPGVGMGFLILVRTGLRPSKPMALRRTDLDMS